jgi:Na+-driven multidrug efflux pump
MSLGIFFYNTILNQTEYPVSAIAAYSTAHRIEHLFFIPIISIATSMITLIGMFFGAKEYNLIDKVIYFAIRTSIIISIIYSIIFYTCAELLLNLFTNETEIINIGAGYFQIFAFAVPFISIAMNCSRAMQGLGKAYPMFIITCLRVIIISCFLAYYFINYLNKPIEFAWIAILISCVTSAFISFIWLFKVKNNLRSLS